MKSRAYTAEEVRAQFIKQAKGLAEYWAKEPKQTAKERCEGVAFSILVLIDGEHGQFPAIDLRLAPHPDDKQYCIDQGENWYEPDMSINDCTECLHELFVREDWEVSE